MNSPSCAARDWRTGFSMCAKRPSSRSATSRAPCTFRWAACRRGSTTCPKTSPSSSCVIMAFAAESLSSFFNARASAMPSTSMAGSMPGHVRSMHPLRGTERLQPSSYAGLPEHFYARLDPTPVAKPRLIQVNRRLAAQLGLDIAALDAEALAAMFSGNLLPQGAEPIAMAYAGHQFGHFVAQLGDGRAILLGEVRDLSGIRRDIQLKGSGRTPFSRDGDGRAAVGPVLREYVVSEAMAVLGVPTTRALAAVTTGEGVRRETMLPGAVLTRVASSHIRVGTFQYFAARADTEGVRRLADHVIARHYPQATEAERPYHALLEGVIARQAELVARWLQGGFIHGG